MDEFSMLEDHSDVESMGNDAASVSSSASPMTVDKRKTISDFIFAFEEKKRKKKKIKPAKEDDNIVSFSPLTFYINKATHENCINN